MQGQDKWKSCQYCNKELWTDRPMLFTMLFNFYVYSQLLQVWADRTSLHPRKQNLHVDIAREVTTNIKGKKNQGEGDGVLQKGRMRRLQRSSDTVRGPKPYKPHRREV